MSTSVIPGERYDWDAARERLLEREQTEGDWGPPWMPEPGDELIGVVKGIEEGVYTSYGPSPVVRLAKPNGEPVVVWLYSKVLRRAFERANVAPGELILIRYRGKVMRDQGGFSYHDYKLVVDRPLHDERVDWKAIAARYGDTDDRNPIPAAPGEDDDWHLRENPCGGEADDIPF